MSKGPEEFKVVVLGDKGVGKTSLVLRYMEGYFSDKQQSTVGAFFLTKNVTVQGARMKMQLWDTAGQERFRSMAPMYYRNAHAAVVCYDMTCEDSFVKAQSWVHELRQNVPHLNSTSDLPSKSPTSTFSSASSRNSDALVADADGLAAPVRHFFLVIVGTKLDREDKRVISRQRGEEFAKKCGASLLETSAMTDQGVQELFGTINENVHAAFNAAGVFDASASGRESFVLTGNMRRTFKEDKSSCFKCG